MFEPTFNNVDESGLRTDVNGFDEVDFQQVGDEYIEPTHFTESATYKEHEPNLEQ